MSTLLTLGEACQRVRLSPWTLRRAIGRGDLLAYKPGNRIRIPESALEDWLRTSRVEPDVEDDYRPLPDVFPQAGDTFRSRLRRKSGERASG